MRFHSTSLRRPFQLIAFIAVISAVLVLWSTGPYHVGLSTDSVGYVTTARNILAGRGGTTLDGKPLLTQPPLYPALLALSASVTSTDPLRVARPLNALLYGVIVATTGVFLLVTLRQSAPIALLAVITTSVSIPLFNVSLMAWSELLFVLLVLLATVSGNSYLRARKRRDLIAMGFLVACACLTRYVGVVLLAWGASSILILNAAEFKQKTARAVGYVCAASLPLAVWLVRNYLASGTLVGLRAASRYTLLQNIGFSVETISSWYLPVHRLGMWPAWLSLISVAMATVMLFVRGRGITTEPSLHPGPLAVFVALYVGFLVITSAFTAYDQIGDRLLAPISIHLNLMLVYVIHRVLNIRCGRKLEVVRRAVLGALVLGMIAWPTLRTARKAVEMRQSGAGYNGREWQESDTVQYVIANRRMLGGAPIFTNAPEAIYLLTGLQSKYSPAATEYNSRNARRPVGELRGRWPPEHNAYLVWFDLRGREFLYTVTELKSAAPLSEVARLKDGSVFKISLEGAK